MARTSRRGFLRLVCGIDGSRLPELLINCRTTEYPTPDLDAAARATTGISAGLLRVSAGLEDARDLWADLERGLAMVQRDAITHTAEMPLTTTR